MVQGVEAVVAALASHHVKGFEAEHHAVSSARLRFGSLAEAGRSLGYSASQMRRRWDQVKELILIPLGLPQHDDLLVGVWVVLHALCCTKPGGGQAAEALADNEASDCAAGLDQASASYHLCASTSCLDIASGRDVPLRVDAVESRHVPTLAYDRARSARFCA